MDFRKTNMHRFLALILGVVILVGCGGGGSAAVGDVPGIKAPAAVTAVSAN
jgi:hypothetical protein